MNALPTPDHGPLLVAWDGSEPDPPFVGPDDSAWGQSWHDRLVASAEYTDVYGQPKKATEAWDHF